MPKKQKKVRWDMDGTYCENTEELAFQGVRDGMIAHAPQLQDVLPDALHLTKFAGYTTIEVIEKITEEPYVKELDLFADKKAVEEYCNKVNDEVTDFQLRAMAEGAQALNGLDHILKREGAEHSIVSTSPMPRLIKTLEGCKKNGLLYEMNQNLVFSATETCMQVLNSPGPIGKPNPTIYLLTEYLTTFQDFKNGTIDSDTLIEIYRIEDSASGVRAAQGAKGLTFDKQGKNGKQVQLETLLKKPEMEIFSQFLANKGERTDFIHFMENQTKQVTIGITMATHIAPEDKAVHGTKLLGLQVDHLATETKHIESFIFGAKLVR